MFMCLLLVFRCSLTLICSEGRVRKPFYPTIVWTEDIMRNLKLLRTRECQASQVFGSPQGFALRVDRGTLLIGSEYGIVELDPLTQEVRCHVYFKVVFVFYRKSLQPCWACGILRTLSQYHHKMAAWVGGGLGPVTEYWEVLWLFSYTGNGCFWIALLADTEVMSFGLFWNIFYSNKAEESQIWLSFREQESKHQGTHQQVSYWRGSHCSDNSFSLSVHSQRTRVICCWL